MEELVFKESSGFETSYKNAFYRMSGNGIQMYFKKNGAFYGVVVSNNNWQTSTTLTYVYPPDFPNPSQYINVLGFFNNLFVLQLFYYGPSARVIFITSTDGLSWRTSYQYPGTAPYIAAKIINNEIVAMNAEGGYTINGVLSGTLVSNDAINWTVTPAPFTSSGWWTHIAYGNGIYVVVGANTSSGVGKIMTSPDRINWTVRNVGMGYVSSMIFQKNIFVVVSDKGIQTSTNGITWTTAKLNWSRDVDSPLKAPNTPFIRIAYGNGVFLALHGSVIYPTLYLSTNGTDWYNTTTTKIKKKYGEIQFLDTDNSFQLFDTTNMKTDHILILSPTNIVLPYSISKLTSALPFNMNAISNNNSIFSYTSSDNSVASVDNLGNVTIIKKGTTIITTSQSLNQNFMSASFSTSLIVRDSIGTLTTTIITAPTTITKRISDTSFNLDIISNNNEASLSYISGNNEIATVNSSGMVTLIYPGITTIKIIQPETNSFTSADITIKLIVLKRQNIIQVPSSFSVKLFIYQGTYNAYVYKNNMILTHNLNIPVFSTTKGSISNTYADSGWGIFEAGSLYTTIGTGVVTVTQGETGDYEEGNASTQVTVTKETSDYLNYITNKLISDTPFSILVSYTNRQTPLVFSSSDTSVATVSTTGVVTILKSGITNITISQIANQNFESGLISFPFTVSSNRTVITAPTSISKTFGDVPFIPVVTSNHSETPLVYTSSDTSVATVSASGQVTIVKVGTVNIVVSQVATINYNTASVSIPLTIIKKNSVLTSPNFSITKRIGEVPFNLGVTSNHSESSLVYTSSSVSVATVSTTGVVTLYRASGSPVNILVSQAASTNYNGSSLTIPVSIIKNTAVLTASNLSISKAISEVPFNLGVTSNHNDFPLVYTSSNTTIATINSNGLVTILKVGTVNISVSQAESNMYYSVSLTIPLTVSNQKTIITTPNLSFLKVFGNVPFNLGVTSNHSENPLVYTSSDTSVATLSASGQVTIVNAGTVTFTVSQAISTNYTSASSTISLTISKKTAVITTPNLSFLKVFGDVPFNLGITTNHSESSLVYTSSDTSVATLSTSGQVTIVKAGTVTFTVSQVTTTNYTSASSTISLSVSKKTAVITSPNLSILKVFGDVSFNLGVTTNHSESPIVYTPSDTSIATINSTGQVIILKAGYVTFTVSQSTTTNYTSASATISLNILIPTIINIPTQISKIYGDEPYNLGVTSNNNISQLVYVSSDTNIATIDSTGQVTILNVGYFSITVSQVVNAKYTSASVTFFLTIANSKTIITIPREISKIYGDDPFNLNVKTNNSDNPLLYVSSDTSIANVSTKGIVTILKSGIVNISVSQFANTNYTSASATISLIISKKTSIITAPINILKVFNDVPFNLNIFSNNNETDIIYSSSNTSIATIDSTKYINILKAGNVNIILFQPESTNYTSASATISLTISKLNAFITTPNLTITKTFEDLPFNLVSTSNHSETLVAYESSNTTIATVSSTGLVTILKAGIVNIMLLQPASTNYNSGSATISLSVLKKNPLITATTLSITKTIGDNPFNIVDIVGLQSNNNEIAFTYSSSNTSIATLSATGQVTILKAGIVNFIVSQVATTNYNSAFITITLNVQKIITFLTAPSLSITKEKTVQPFNLNVTSNNNESLINYFSSDTTIATISATGLVTILKVGNVTFTALQSSSTNYTNAFVTITLNVVKTITFITAPSLSITKERTAQPFNLNVTSNNNESLINYISSDTTIATISATGVVTILKVGNVRFTVSQIASTNYSSGSAAISLNIIKTPTVINAPTNISNEVGDTFDLIGKGVTSNNTEVPFNYTSSNTTIATISATGEVTILNTGFATITVSQIASTNYSSGSVTIILNISKIKTVITAPTNISKEVGDTFNLISEGLISNNTEVPFNYTSSNTTIATISATGLVTILNTGNVTFTALQIANTNYTSASATISLNINKKITVITAPTNISKEVGDTFDLISEGLISNNTEVPFNYTSSNTNIATISATGEVTILNTGFAIITINQNSNANYTSDFVSISLSVFKKNNVITAPEIIFKDFDEPEFNLSEVGVSSNNNNGTFTYESSDLNVATIDNLGNITIFNQGFAIIKIEQNSSLNYTSASVSIVLVVTKKTNVINAPEFISKNVGDNFNLSEVGVSSNNNEVGFTYESSDENVATINSFGEVNITAEGNIYILINQTETNNFSSASFIINLVSSSENTNDNTNRELTNSQPTNSPFDTITGTSSYVKKLGQHFNLNITTTNTQTPVSYSSSNINVATVNNLGYVTILNTGTTTITASQNINQKLRKFSSFLVVTKLTPTLFSPLLNITKELKDASFNLDITTDNTETNNMIATYSDINVATFNNRIVTILNPGVTDIKITQNESASYYSSSITINLIVKKAETSITAPKLYNLNVNKVAYLSSENLANNLLKINLLSNNNSLFDFSSTNENIASVNANGEVNALHEGETDIIITQRESDRFYGKTTKIALSVSKQLTSINAPQVINANLGRPLKLTKTNPSQQKGQEEEISIITDNDSPIIYSIIDSSIATIDENGFLTVLKDGITEIVLSQLSNNVFYNSIFYITLIISKQSAFTASTELILKEFGDEQFDLNQFIVKSDPNIVLTYTSSDETIAKVDNFGKVDIFKAGTSNIVVTISENKNYYGVSLSMVLNVSKQIPILIDVLEKIVKNITDSYFNLSDLIQTFNNDPSIVLTYTSSDERIAKVNNFGVVDIFKAGTTDIEVTANESENFYGKTFSQTLYVSKVTPNITAPERVSLVYGDPKFNLNVTSNVPGGVLTYTSSDETVAKVNSVGDVDILKPGIINILVTTTETETFFSASTSISLYVSKVTPNISASQIFSKKYGDPNFNLNVTSNVPGGIFTYTSSDETVAKVNSVGNVEILKPGIINILVTTTETETFFSVSTLISLYVSKVKPEIYNVPERIIKNYGELSFNLGLTNTPNSTIIYSSSDETVAKVNSLGVVTILKIGITEIKASIIENTFFTSFFVTIPLSVLKNLTIINLNKNIRKFTTDADFDLNVITNNTDTPLIYTLLNTNIITVNSAGRVKIIDKGIAVIKVSQIETENFYIDETRYPNGSFITVIIDSTTKSNPKLLSNDTFKSIVSTQNIPNFVLITESIKINKISVTSNVKFSSNKKIKIYV